MPLTKIHVCSGVYEQARLEKISHAVRSALLDILKTPPDDFFQVIFELPNNHFFHPPSFLGHTYSKEFILLEVTFGAGRSTDTHLTLLKELNHRVVSEAGILPDDLVILLFDISYDNISFGRGIAGAGKV
jgi:Tautomerase enzyme